MAKRAANRARQLLQAALRRPAPSGRTLDPLELDLAARRARLRLLAEDHRAPDPQPPKP